MSACPGARVRIARRMARAVRFAVRSAPNAQPTMRREYTSRTAARKQGRPLALR